LVRDGFVKDHELEPDLEPFSVYLEAFYELSSCRNTGLGMGPIPFTAIVQYFKIYRIGSFDEFLYLMRRMDIELLKLDKERSEREQKSGAKRGTNHSGKANKNRR
jgi:hypothetical protein